MADCETGVVRTGGVAFKGEGDCSAWSAAIVFFVLAAVYAGVYVLYMAGLMHNQHKNWGKFCMEGSYSKCCVDTKVELKNWVKLCEKTPCKGPALTIQQHHSFVGLEAVFSANPHLRSRQDFFLTDSSLVGLLYLSQSASSAW